MVNLSGYYFIDGVDLWLNYALAIKKGSADLLRYPAKKESITHDWPDKNGLDVDLTKVYLKERSVALECMIITYTEAEFWLKHNAFIQKLVQPSLRRLTITGHGGRSYFVYYQECNSYRQLPNGTLKGIDANMVVHEFTLVLMEPEPILEPSDHFVVADDGAFLIT